MSFYRKYGKRIFDLCLTVPSFVVLSPVMLVTAGLVAVKLGRPVLFTQERPGYKEKIFRMYKFRTMTDARNANGELLSDEERLTPFGEKLRSTSLDELPELLNILKGDMSLVGPRPAFGSVSARFIIRGSISGTVCFLELQGWHRLMDGTVFPGKKNLNMMYNMQSM